MSLTSSGIFPTAWAASVWKYTFLELQIRPEETTEGKNHSTMLGSHLAVTQQHTMSSKAKLHLALAFSHTVNNFSLSLFLLSSSHSLCHSQLVSFTRKIKGKYTSPNQNIPDILMCKTLLTLLTRAFPYIRPTFISFLI